jgi:hypothetical protein
VQNKKIFVPIDLNILNGPDREVYLREICSKGMTIFSLVKKQDLPDFPKSGCGFTFGDMVFENFATQNQMIRALRPFVTNSDVPPHR